MPASKNEGEWWHPFHPTCAFGGMSVENGPATNTALSDMIGDRAQPCTFPHHYVVGISMISVINHNKSKANVVLPFSSGKACLPNSQLRLSGPKKEGGWSRILPLMHPSLQNTTGPILS